MSLECPLCLLENPGEFWTKETGLVFYRCLQCDLIFKDPAKRPSQEEELKLYGFHQNSPEDADYQKHLSILCDAMSSQLIPGQSGMDFGCGPTQVMADLFNRKGLTCVSYDPYFFPDKSVLTKKYDFISCCETAEHFYNPSKEFPLLFELLKPGALLGIRTKLVPENFANWWYHKDPTHVVFYSPPTFKWIAERFSAELQLLPQDVAIMKSFNQLKFLRKSDS